MKKGIFWVSFAIVLGVVGMPVLNGMIVEKWVRQSFEDMNLSTKASGSGALFEITRYDRRFFFFYNSMENRFPGPGKVLGNS